jgi:hypothetical protein
MIIVTVLMELMGALGAVVIMTHVLALEAREKLR